MVGRIIVAKPISLMSPEDYLASEWVAPFKHEYVDGRVYRRAVSDVGHNRVVMAATGAIGVRLRGKRCEPFDADTKVRVRLRDNTRFYYPDAMVVCEPNPGDDVFQDRPVVIAEVLSPSTRRIDEYEKREAYLTIPSLSAYLLIETTSPRVVVYARDAAGGGFTPRAYEGMETLLPLDAIGIALPLAELYERVDFAAAAKEDADEAEANGYPTEA